MSTLVDMTTSDVFDVIVSLLGVSDDAAKLDWPVSEGTVLSLYV